MRDADYAGIFALEDPVADEPYRGQFVPLEAGLALSRGQGNASPGVTVTWAMGAPDPGDVIWTTSGAHLIVHERVLALFRTHAWTGWRSFPLEVRSRDGRAHSDCHGLAITGRCGTVDLSRSRIALRQFPGGWYPYLVGHYFRGDAWDGSDLAMPDTESSLRFVAGRVQEALVAAPLSNLRPQRLTEVTVPAAIYEIGARHLLPPDYEERLSAAYRARGLSRPKAVS